MPGALLFSAPAAAAQEAPFREERVGGALRREGGRAGEADRAKCEERGILVRPGDSERQRDSGNLPGILLLPRLPPPPLVPKGSCRLAIGLLLSRGGARSSCDCCGPVAWLSLVVRCL